MTYIGEKGQIVIFKLNFWIRLGLEMVFPEGPLARDSLKYFKVHLKLQMYFTKSVGGTITPTVRRPWTLLGALNLYKKS